MEEGFSVAIERKERLTPPREILFGGEFEAHLLALACSEAPEGKADGRFGFWLKNWSS